MTTHSDNIGNPKIKKVACACCLDEYCFDELKEGLCETCITTNSNNELEEFLEY